MKAGGRIIFAACAVLFAFAAGASASARPHRRHVEWRPPSARDLAYGDSRDGNQVTISFQEPDIAVLSVGGFDAETQAGAETSYAARYRGSAAAGRLRARFGAIGLIDLRFVPGPGYRLRKVPSNCEGPGARRESGHFVGRVDLRGEGGYFHLSTARLTGFRIRKFRRRCRVKHRSKIYPPPSLVEAVESASQLIGPESDNLASLQAGNREAGREVALLAALGGGARRGALVAAGTFEYQGEMPVGRFAFAFESPPGTLETSLPGVHPATATLSPRAPFSGEGVYLATSPTSHDWTGDLAVQFPGLRQPLAGPRFFSTLCVVSALRARFGCDLVTPNWEPAG